jgi:hypothetical protein
LVPSEVEAQITERVDIKVGQHPQRGLEITVEPWLRELNPDDSIEWKLTVTGNLSVQFDVLNKPEANQKQNRPPHKRPLPARTVDQANTKAHGPFLRNPDIPGIWDRYDLKLVVDGQKITLDPDYRVRP